MIITNNKMLHNIGVRETDFPESISPTPLQSLVTS